MRIMVEIKGEKGITVPVTLFSDLAYLRHGTWMCPPGYLRVFSGYFELNGGDIHLFDNKPSGSGDFNYQAILHDLKPKQGATGRAEMLGTGPLGSTLRYTEQWKVREAIGVGEVTLTVGFNRTTFNIGD